MNKVNDSAMVNQPPAPSVFSFLTGWHLPSIDAYFSEKKVSEEDECKNQTEVNNEVKKMHTRSKSGISRASSAGTEFNFVQARSTSLATHRRRESADSVDSMLSNMNRKKANRRELLANILGQGAADISDDYAIGKKVGRCKFGNVHSAHDRKTQEQVLCKKIAKAELLVEKDVNAVKDEIAIMHVLKNQPNVAHLLATYEDSQYVYLVLEWCSGDELLDLIVNKGKYTERQAASVFYSIMDIVKTCHFLGIMLRNIQLENFRYSSKKRDSILKCVDFSEAILLKVGECCKDFVGSLTYMAPEVLFRKYGMEADIWSCGVVLHILLCGDPPFDSGKDSEAFQNIIGGTVSFNTGAWSKVSEPAKDLTRRMLARNATKRITARHAVEHKWFEIRGAEDTSVEQLLDPSILVRLQKINSVTKMKRLACQVIAKRLPKAEMQKLRSTYEALDRNGDGSLSYSELRRGLMGINMRGLDVEALLDVMDVDKGGSIDYNEFITAMLSVRKTYDVTDMARAFHFFDADGNGYITVSELQKALEEEYDVAAGEVEQMVKKADVDGNGKLDFEEFVAMMQSCD